jgi:hypothetical protein
MDNVIETTRKQVLRGAVLRICEQTRETGAGVQLLEVILRKLKISATQQDVTDACHYLQGRGLIRFESFSNKALNIRRDIAFITSAGIDALESDKPVDGVAEFCVNPQNS